MSGVKKIDSLDAPNVNTNDILSILGKDYIRILQVEQSARNALTEIHNFFYHETPEWKSEQVIDKNTGNITKEGIMEEILYQYKPENQSLFNKNSIILSNSMSSINIVIEYLEERFWRLEHGKEQATLVSSLANIPSPISQPPVVAKEGIVHKLSNAFA